MIQVKCLYCEKYFDKQSHEVKRSPNHLCSRDCFNLYQRRRITEPCANCGHLVTRKMKERQRFKNCFCSSSCSATYNNKQRKGYRRSKCEIYLCSLIKNAFPDLEIVENSRDILDGFEVDIYLPQLRLGIEWNGKVHFLPIFGQTKLDRIKQIDQEKLHIAQQKGIKLIIIPDFVSNKQRVIEAFEEIKPYILSGR